GCGEFQVVEADDGQIAGDRYLPALAFEQDAERKVIVDAEHGVDVVRLCRESGEQGAAKCHGGRYGGRDDEGRVEQRGCFHGITIPLEAPPHARVTWSAEQSTGEAAPVA